MEFYRGLVNASGVTRRGGDRRADEEQRSADFARKERGSPRARANASEARGRPQGRRCRPAGARGRRRAQYADLAFNLRACCDDDVAVGAGLDG